MPSKSKKQQRLFGLVAHCQDTGECPSKKIKSMAKSMSKKVVRDFARTKHKDLPESVKPKLKTFAEFVRLKENESLCECKCEGCKTSCKNCNCKNCKCKGCNCNKN